MHLFSRDVFEKERAALATASEDYRKGYETWKAGFKKRFNAPFAEDPGGDSASLAQRWGRLLDEAGVDKACFIATDPESRDLTDFVSRCPSRFYALATADPRDPEAPAKLRKLVHDYGYRGLKLYPTTGRFSLADRMLYPLFEEAGSLGIPVVAHFGITLDYNADMRYSDPSSLHAAARDFPSIPFIVPHFAAGYFRELLFLGYHAPNIYVDTSGTNRWIEYLPEQLSLREVFKKALSVFGPDHILFGTDSRMLSQGYRMKILEEQERILGDLSLSIEDRALVMGGNAARLYRLD
jgi:predicted TIM-barrel fold metal-dependent hydrolase